MKMVIAAALIAVALSGCGSRDTEGEFLTEVLKHQETRK